MKLFFWRGKHGIKNFGDELNTRIWNQFIPGILDDNPETLFMGFGTILNQSQIPQARHLVIFSSGAGNGEVPKVAPNWKIYCVRGPLSAQVLNIDRDRAVCDGAMLVREFYKL